uniref:Protein kinase domain-containing protein n=1 Tax=Hyaloperonospora arabidopsidis (strain Emoy2) TaxID=559515 RepID=M4BLF5_HYAAE
MNGSIAARQPRRYEATRRHLLPLLLLLYSVATSHVAAESCVYASTLVADASDATAIVYDAACNPRSFQVVGGSTVERSLNLSNLDVVAVQSYPRVYQLLLNNNELEAFVATDSDNDMKDLQLSSNLITDLSSSSFPQRLSYLDLSKNSITTLSSATPWPESGDLQTLLLHGNSLKSVAADTFMKFGALRSLSLSSTGISNLDDLMLPVSLRTLNASKNSFTSASTSFENLPTALQYLNLEGNGIKKVSGVTFASTLRKVSLSDNPLSTIEICRSDVIVFETLTELTAPSSVSSTCSNSSATSMDIHGVTICVFEDEVCISASATDSKPGSSTAAVIPDIPSGSSDGTSSSTSSDSIFSAGSIGIIGGTFFLVGILLSALAFGLVWKKRRDNDSSPTRCPALKINRDRRLGSSGGNFVVFTGSGRTSRVNRIIVNDNYLDSKNESTSTFGSTGIRTPDEAAWTIYESPLDKYNPVALLEPSPNGDKNFLGASTISLQARSKLKIKVDLDDLLVYEIPPEEIQMRRALCMASSKMSSKAALALSSVGVGNARKKVDSALFLAEYQGYKVVIHALVRSKKQLEKRFIEQIRLAASLDHASIVHFIGVTTGCSTTASRRRGSSAAMSRAPYASYGPANTVDESRGSSTTKSRYPNMGAPSWHLGVVFEYMQHGSLASMFAAERCRREGKGYYPNSSVAAAIGSGSGNIFSWYPMFANSNASVNANPNADWRCKLSIALDVAMGLVYLHANYHAHGRVCARKVLVNEQGEAKLSAMDVLLPSDLASSKDDAYGKVDDFRGSLRDSARWTVQKITGLRSTRSSRAQRRQASGNRSRYANNSGESDASGASGISSVTLDDNNSRSGENPALAEGLNDLNESSLKSSGIGSSIVAAQRDDVYAFGTFLWELDTMTAVEEDLASSRMPAGHGGNPHLLTFSADCPSELQELARQCWHEVPSERPDAIDVQEELVRVLEGRLTTTNHVPLNWTRPSYFSSTSAISSLSSSDLSSLPSSCSAMAVSVVDLRSGRMAK